MINYNELSLPEKSLLDGLKYELDEMERIESEVHGGGRQGHKEAVSYIRCWIEAKIDMTEIIDYLDYSLQEKGTS